MARGNHIFVSQQAYRPWGRAVRSTGWTTTPWSTSPGSTPTPTLGGPASGRRSAAGRAVVYLDSQRNSPGDAQAGTTGVLRVGTSARTDLSMRRCARTSSKGVNASHCRSDTSMNLSVFHTSRNCNFVVPVFSM